MLSDKIITWNEAVDPRAGIENARTLFVETFGTEPTGVWSAPGRVNIIGEHVDYNGGPCLPIALPHRAYIAVSMRNDRRIRLVSPQTREQIDELDLDQIGPRGSEYEVTTWAAYLAGVAWAFERAGYGPLQGFDAALWSCVPRGGGLSSSAALECAMAVALDDLGDFGIAGTVQAPHDEGRKILVDLCRRAENEIAGANTGGLDQTASLRCRAGHALALDCRDMSVAHIPFDLASEDLALLVIDTRAAHSLADGQYGQRRADSEEAARILGVNLLVEAEDVEAATRVLSEVGADSQRLVQRTRHVISEIARTRAFIDVLTQGPLEGERLYVAGALMNDSHDSLRDDYEVSCEELDVAVAAARAAGAYGARMTGGGFGGSAIALVRLNEAEKVARTVARAYADRGWESPHFLTAIAGAPAGRDI
ncbi:galactokinase [Schaalia sp. lx-100]|uniref:galactokinase n=1 Tax=Schaalia sp. lx-100 TaxID=2899081 RepID=UPI001E43B244|nr:galactokinase [Schaalia sp. lx-100]MCD4556791.1 galactokinase [Schaalia sp. lx-100]